MSGARDVINANKTRPTIRKVNTKIHEDLLMEWREIKRIPRSQEKVRRVSQLVQVATIANPSVLSNQTRPRNEMLSDTRAWNEGSPFPPLLFSPSGSAFGTTREWKERKEKKK